MHEFTLEQAQKLINKMRSTYGRKFTDLWAAVAEEELEVTLIQDLSGLTPQQINNGYKRMRDEIWPPTIPEFRIWCLQGSNWLTENEAWHQALAYEKSNQKISISYHVLKTLKKFKKGFSEITSNSETQAKAFKDMYIRIITDAKLIGDIQTLIKPLGEEEQTSEEQTSEERDCVPCPKDLKEKIKCIINQPSSVITEVKKAGV